MPRIPIKTIGDLESLREEAKKKAEELIAKSKPLDELVVLEEFVVESVNSVNYETSFRPVSEVKIGRYSPVYNTGFTTLVSLIVTPYNVNVPVRKLEFYGNSSVEAGNHIRARIPKYKEEVVRNDIYFTFPEKIYLDRKFREQELAIELEIIGRHREVVRVERSVDYRKFVKK